ncbi:plasmid mobilization protein [Streptococcus suis]|uniref:plasmid mobilization protein n=1 Tax=Streptococcus suis TaxID=1307 RepID=UPI003AF6B3F9
MQETKRPRGRPATGRERNKLLNIRVTEEERNQIKQSAHDSGMTVADWIVSKIEK